jgi:hypothetical protein
VAPAATAATAVSPVMLAGGAEPLADAVTAPMVTVEVDGLALAEAAAVAADWVRASDGGGPLPEAVPEGGALDTN